MCGRIEYRQAKTRWNLSGLQRFWLYRVAMATGLRASELASLTPQSFGGGQVAINAAYNRYLGGGIRGEH